MTDVRRAKEAVRGGVDQALLCSWRCRTPKMTEPVVVVTLGPEHDELPADEEGGRAMARTFGHPGEGQAGRPDLLLDVLVHRPKLCKPAGTMADGLSQKRGGPSVSPGGDVAVSGVTGIARRRTLR